MSDSKKLIKNSALYTLGNILLKAFSFLLIPLYTSYLTTEDYGITNLVSSFTALLSCIITLSLQNAVIRFYSDVKENNDKVSRIYGTVVTFVFIFGTVLSLLLIATHSIWTNIFFKNIPFIPIVLLSIIISIVSGLYTIYQDILKGMQDAKRSVVLSFVFFFLLLFFNILAVVVLDLGALGMVWSTMIVNAVMSFYMIIDLKKRSLFAFCLDRKLLKELLNYSLPLVPHSLSYNITFSATRVLINSKLSLSVLGLFSLASQFGYMSDIILNSFQSAFQPWMYDMMGYNNDASRDRIRKATYSLMWIMGLIYILVGSFSQEAIYIMADKEYWAAWKFVPVLVVSVALKAPLYFYTNFLYYDKSKTRYVFIATLVACVLNISLTWLLIPYYGVYGSIIADIISMIIRVIIVVYIARKISEGIYSFVKLGLLSIVPVLFLTAAMLPSYLYFGEKLSITMILYKMFIILLYIILISVFNKGLLNNIKIIKR